jgi:hypothetical protein
MAIERIERAVEDLRMVQKNGQNRTVFENCGDDRIIEGMKNATEKGDFDLTKVG